MSFLFAIAGALVVWGMSWVLEPIPPPVKYEPQLPTEKGTNMTKKELFLFKLKQKQYMIKKNAKKRMCKIGFKYHDHYCYRLIPYTFQWLKAKKACMDKGARLTTVFSRKRGKDFVIQSMERFKMRNVNAAVGYYADVEDDYDDDELLDVRVRDLAGKDVTNKVEIENSNRFDKPTTRNVRVAYLTKGKLYWFPNTTFGWPYCEYHRIEQYEPPRYEGYPDPD